MKPIINSPGKKRKEKIEKEVKKFLKKTSEFFNKETAEKIAKETKFVQRESKLKPLPFLAAFVIAASDKEKATLEEIISHLYTNRKSFNKDFSISKQGLDQRINAYTVEFFKRVLALTVKQTIPESLTLPIAPQFSRVLIWDSTEFQLPEELATIFPGKGGSASNAGLKIQFCYDLKAAESLYTLKSGASNDSSLSPEIIEQTQPGDLLIHDLGYFCVKTFKALNDKNAYFISRLKSKVVPYIQNQFGNLVRFNILNWISTPGFTRSDCQVFIQCKHKVFTPVRLIIEKVPDAIANERLRKMQEKARSRGKQVSDEQRLLETVNIFITNVSAELFPAAACWKLYSIRWQIELIFKAWKSHFHIHLLPGSTSERILCTLFAKLIFITLSSKIVHIASVSLWVSSCREVSHFRAIAHLLTQIQSWFSFVLSQSFSSLFSLLSDSLFFIQKHCFKVRQKDRVYPLELLQNLFNLSLA